MIPQNQEHLEAQQAAINEERQKRKLLMSGEEVARLELIEEFSQKMKDNNVPFLLFSRVDKKGFYQFNCLTFEEDPTCEKAQIEGMNNFNGLLDALSYYLSFFRYFIVKLPSK